VFDHPESGTELSWEVRRPAVIRSPRLLPKDRQNEGRSLEAAKPFTLVAEPLAFGAIASTRMTDCRVLSGSRPIRSVKSPLNVARFHELSERQEGAVPMLVFQADVYTARRGRQL
jgi:hypothetical protein